MIMQKIDKLKLSLNKITWLNQGIVQMHYIYEKGKYYLKVNFYQIGESLSSIFSSILIGGKQTPSWTLFFYCYFIIFFAFFWRGFRTL